MPPRFRDPSLLVAGAIRHVCPFFLWCAVPRHVRAALGYRRADRHPAGPGRRAARAVGGRLPAGYRRCADRRVPADHRAPVAAAPGRVDPDHRHRPARGRVPELLLHRRVGHLGEPGHPAHHRQRAGHRAGRRAGHRAAPAGAARGRHHRAGPGRPRPAGRPAGRWVPGDRGAGQRRAGGGVRRRVRRHDPGRGPAGGRPGRPDRDRLRLHAGRPGAAAAGRGGGRADLHPASGRDRAADRAGHRPHRGGLHAVLPRPAHRHAQHGRAAHPARAADRHHPGHGAARQPAGRRRGSRGRAARRGRDRHGALSRPPCGPRWWPSTARPRTTAPARRTPATRRRR